MITGEGVRAIWNSVPGTGTLIPGTGTPTSGTPAFASSRNFSASVSTQQELERAVADPDVAVVVVRAHIFLRNATILVTGSRALQVTGDASACGSRSYAEGFPSIGACTLDAGFLSRHFEVTAGASLTLSGLALVGGLATQGGAVLVVGSRLSASSCVFADSVALGDGGAVMALAGSTVSLSGCALPISPSASDRAV